MERFAACNEHGKSFSIFVWLLTDWHACKFKFSFMLFNSLTFGVLREDERMLDKRSTPWPKGNAVSCWELRVKSRVYALHWQSEYLLHNLHFSICIRANLSQECSMMWALGAKYHVLSVTRPLWWGTRSWHGSAISIHITHYRYVTLVTWSVMRLIASVTNVYFHACPILCWLL